MLFLIGSFIAGILTVLAPCVLPLLPIIIGGSMSGNVSDKKRPFIITAALASSLFIFTLLLKATTAFANVSPSVFTYISGTILLVLGVVTLFPSIYARFISLIGVERRAQKALSEGVADKRNFLGPVVIGLALGPVFSSCSPVYGYILATVLPVNFVQALFYITAYILGLSLVLLLIGFYGQRFVRKIRFATNPKGWFQRIIAILFIVVGLLIITGYDKRFQTWVSVHTPFNFDGLSQKFLPASNRTSQSGDLNVASYQAPEFKGLESWINSQPLLLSELKGKVVVVDFWTYSCINCIRNNPYLESWYQRYKDDGLVVIGLHAPEFSFERSMQNVQKAVKEQGISYPVALDNGFTTWGVFNNRYWPAAYFIDGQGQVRRVHEGEGEYEESENAIRQLLEENGARLSEQRAMTKDGVVPVREDQTPETYLGTNKASDYVGSPALGAQEMMPFVFAPSLEQNQWTLNGEWRVESESITAQSASKIRFKIGSKEAYVVASAPQGGTIDIMLNGKPISAEIAGQDVSSGRVQVGESKLYRLVSLPAFQSSYELELSVSAGVSLNVFTFGS